MFKKIGMNAAKHSSGYIVQITGRYEIKYSEDNRVLLLEIEPGVDLAIYKDSIKSWEEPYSKEHISDKKKKEILSCIDQALDYLGIEHRFL